MEKELQLLELPTWFEKYPGQYYLKCEQEQLRFLLPEFHGYYLVQLGVFDQYELQASSTMSQQIYVGKSHQNTHIGKIIEANLNDLPFQSESVDLFIVPHTLEFSDHPDKLVSEIYNILIPGGKVIILGFNPFSLVGLAKLLKSPKTTPWGGSFYSMGHVKFWLRATGFSLQYQKSFCFRPPFKSESVLKNLSFLEPFGQFCFPLCGGIYILVAEKKTVALPTPLKRKVYTKKIRVRSGLPEPTTNKSM